MCLATTKRLIVNVLSKDNLSVPATVPASSPVPATTTTCDRRKITQLPSWKRLESESEVSDKCFVAELLRIHTTSLNEEIPRENVASIYSLNTVRSQLVSKLCGYRHQDQQKDLYDEKSFVQLGDALTLLSDSSMLCFYCLEQVKIIYTQVRDPKQWTLERIDNSMGHNRGNVVISCLSCNIRRRCMYHERYVFTKQAAAIVTKLNYTPSVEIPPLLSVRDESTKTIYYDPNNTYK